ncbi:site-specific integrase [Micromonospora sp. NPDC047465]|uniref:tyrosine-type recombinase/integrase n=1 Tax=Micromonospora sp. NPDC047465 TaxID=3154813 RepID=UPI0033E12C52
MPPAVAKLVDAYLEYRAGQAGVSVDQLTGPLFVTLAGERIDRHEVARFVRRLAKAAGMPNWQKITPHSCRHAWNTIARANGADLEDRQRAMGHADPRTTQRYDRDRDSLDRDPSWLVAAATFGT